MNKHLATKLPTKCKSGLAVPTEPHLRSVVPQAMKLSPHSGVLEPESRFAGGSILALKKKPRSIKQYDSYYCKLLRTLPPSSSPAAVTEIASTYNLTYS
jgi:hypothetical protein